MGLVGSIKMVMIGRVDVDRMIWERKRRGDLGARLNVRGVEQPVVMGLYADDTVLLARSEGMLQRIVDNFDKVCIFYSVLFILTPAPKSSH